MGIAENIKRIRESHNMSQNDFGKIAGVSDKAVSTWELGKKVPRMGAIEKISQYFQISKSEIIDSHADVNPPILTKYNKLNHKGKEKLEAYADDLSENPKYSIAEHDENLRVAAFHEATPVVVTNKNKIKHT